MGRATALAPAHVLGRALARFQLSTGFGLAAATLLSASAVAR
ncbi:hypothetical protein [Actinopolymorpha alba]|nr:hypothetical protein [Actinopolymorpha alba]